MRKNSKLPITLAKKIKRRRKDLGITQEGLAEKVKISRAYMGFIEQSRYMPSVEVLERIARALGIKLSNLFP